MRLIKCTTHTIGGQNNNRTTRQCDLRLCLQEQQLWKWSIGANFSWVTHVKLGSASILYQELVSSNIVGQFYQASYSQFLAFHCVISSLGITYSNLIIGRMQFPCSTALLFVRQHTTLFFAFIINKNQPQALPSKLLKKP